MIFFEKSVIFLEKNDFCGEKTAFTTFFRGRERVRPKTFFAKVSQILRKRCATAL
jgi:hypothetical protein